MNYIPALSILALEKWATSNLDVPCIFYLIVGEINQQLRPNFSEVFAGFFICKPLVRKEIFC
jgi:hypothetical protein